MSPENDTHATFTQLCRDFVRLLNCADDTNSVRLAFEKLLHTRDDRGRGGTVAASGV